MTPAAPIPGREGPRRRGGRPWTRHDRRRNQPDPPGVRAVVDCPLDRLAAAEQDVSAAVQQVADATTVVRGIGVAVVALSDLRRTRAPCVTGPQLAAGIVERIPRVSAGDGTDVPDPGAFGRGLSMAAAMRLSVADRRWSADRAEGVALLTRHDRRAGQAAAAVHAWADSRGPSFGDPPVDHRDQLVRLAHWVPTVYEAPDPPTTRPPEHRANLVDPARIRAGSTIPVLYGGPGRDGPSPQPPRRVRRPGWPSRPREHGPWPTAIFSSGPVGAIQRVGRHNA